MQQITHKFFLGDALEVLRTLPPSSVDCVVTSPPYWNLRDYKVDGQIGLEKSPEEFICRLVSVFGEVWRVLKTTGSCWVNLGDTYWGGGQGKSGGTGLYADRKRRPERSGRSGTRRRDGWKCRKQLLLIPSRFAIAMQEGGWILRNDVTWGKSNAMPSSVKDRLGNSSEHLFHFVKQEKYHFDLDDIRVPWTQEELMERYSQKYQAAGIPPFWLTEYREWYHELREKRSWHDHQNDGEMGFGQQTRGQGRKYGNLPHPDGKNPGDVWIIPTEPFAGAHFATFPAALVERPIKATCQTGGIVLDPFGGAGTTSLVAAKLERSSIYIDLNPAYREIAVKRLREEVADQMSFFVEHRIEVVA